MSRFVMLVGVLVASMAAWPSGQVGRPPTPGAPTGPQPAGTGFIGGQVVDASTGRPVAEAQVLLQPRNLTGGRGAAAPPVISDAQGRFFFRGLQPGTYGVSASRAGYAAIRPTLVDVADAERVLDARVRVTRLAAIGGAVRDSSGDPVVGTQVIAFQRSYASGRLQLQQVRAMRSDDRGMYRIPLLPPGDYLVCACVREPIPFDQLLLTTLASEPFNLMSLAARALTSGSDVVSLDNTLRGLAPTFHLASRSMAEATKVTVAAGEDKTGVDITAELVRATRVSGRIVGAQSPMAASSVRLVPQTDADAGIQLTSFQPMLMQPDGRFDFANVPPGQYRLIVTHPETGARGGGPSGLAMSFTGGRAGPPPSASIQVTSAGIVTPSMLWATDTVTVGDRGLTGLVVALTESLSISGRVQFVGSTPQPSPQILARSNVGLLPLTSPTGALATASGPLTASASFQVTGVVPGRYIVLFSGAVGYPNLRSVTLAGVDVTDLPIEIGTKEPGELIVTYVDTPATALTVTTPIQQGQRADEVTALLFPADRRYWPDPSAARRRFRVQGLSSKGLATLPDLPVGDYFVVLDPNFVQADWQETTLEALSRRAQRVALVDGERRTVEIRR